MTIVNVTLTGDLEKIVNDYIKSGRATSKTEVIRMGLQRLPQLNAAAENDSIIKKLPPEQWQKEFDALREEMAVYTFEETEKLIKEAEAERDNKLLAEFENLSLQSKAAHAETEKAASGAKKAGSRRRRHVP